MVVEFVLVLFVKMTDLEKSSCGRASITCLTTILYPASMETPIGCHVHIMHCVTQRFSSGQLSVEHQKYLYLYKVIQPHFSPDCQDELSTATRVDVAVSGFVS